MQIFEDYQFVCKHKPTTKEGGGLCIYVKNGIHYKIRNDITFLNNNVSYYDCLFIEILNNTHDATHKNLLIGSIYRSPDSNTHNLFTQDLDQITKRMQNENKHIIICGDANINLLNVENNIYSAADYLDMFMSNGFIQSDLLSF